MYSSSSFSHSSFLLITFFLSFTLLMFFSSVSADEMPEAMEGGAAGPSSFEEEIVIPWKKLYRPRGPPRFGKRALVLLDDETVPVAWKKRMN